MAYLDDALNAVDGAAEETLEFGVVVGVVGVSDAHEEDVGRKTGRRVAALFGFSSRIRF